MTDQAFTDPGTVLADFADEVLVVCPACSRLARVMPRSAGARSLFEPRRMVCAHCGCTEDWSGNHVSIGDDADPWFRQPLWLRTSVRGHTLWAWNVRHVDLLDAVVSARVRRRRDEPGAASTLVETLPAWMKDGANRDAVRAGIGWLRARLAEA